MNRYDVSMDIQDFLQLKEHDKIKFLTKIIFDLKYIFDNEIVHNDVKMENIFTKNFVPILGDFGLSIKKNNIPQNIFTNLKKKDIYSLGIALLAICSGEKNERLFNKKK